MESEEDLQKMISNVQFRRVNNDFQNRLKNDIRSIQSSKKVFVFSQYEKLLTDKITKTYKQSNDKSL